MSEKKAKNANAIRQRQWQDARTEAIVVADELVTLLEAMPKALPIKVSKAVKRYRKIRPVVG